MTITLNGTINEFRYCHLIAEQQRVSETDQTDKLAGPLSASLIAADYERDDCTNHGHHHWGDSEWKMWTGCLLVIRGQN